MKPLHQILPSLESSVIARRYDPAISEMDEGDLRTLVYELVRHYQRQREDPDMAYDTMARAVKKRAESLGAERIAGVTLRATVLDRMLEIGQLAMTGLAQPLRTRIVRNGAEQQCTTHPSLRGIELGNNRKKISDGLGTRRISGSSWWIVTSSGRMDVCWAILDHVGSIDAAGCGEEKIVINATDPEELARQVNEKIIGDMLLTLGSQLRSAQHASASPEISKIRGKLDAIVDLLRDE